jgi:hypothetical protein
MFCNTGIATYVWVLSNQRTEERKVQLINGVNLCGNMRKSLDSKRNEMSGDDMVLLSADPRSAVSCVFDFPLKDQLPLIPSSVLTGVDNVKSVRLIVWLRILSGGEQ